MNTDPHALFSVHGVEIEYMIVDVDSLDVAPRCDALFESIAGEPANEIPRGEISWSNELAAHLLELKTSQPVPRLEGVANAFQRSVEDAGQLLREHGARLLPGAMHPWMDPHRELRLWPWGQQDVYRAYDRIFDCRGHGWANLQSVHLNLPFATDAEFALLHTVIRHLLPLLPTLAASSPIADGRDTGWQDYRMEVYRHNADRVPSVAGLIVPEPVASIAEYRATILEPMYRAIAPLDPGRVLQEEWLNSRGAIARFDRDAIELRVLDVQERPAADLAILSAITAILRALAEERFGHAAALRELDTRRLAALLEQAIDLGDALRIDDTRWLRSFGLPPRTTWARDVWATLLDECDDLVAANGVDLAPVEWILERGTLASRMLAAVGSRPSMSVMPGEPTPPLPAERLRAVCRELADCLDSDRPFHGI
ncbi:MAG: glutamate-cysteine ligase family protein [Pseudomonadales bacterium]|jgi:gamma-glutamyl:cysteine ligase YbdK (ATP-grasp superfamily)|nr:glutamate-cysteine ligase family protein [Pseudomonadales bacterium]